KLTSTLISYTTLFRSNELTHLYELVSLHNEALFIVGDLSSQALHVRDTSYLERKRIYAETILNESGTVAVKEAKAELSIHDLRRSEEHKSELQSRFDL